MSAGRLHAGRYPYAGPSAARAAGDVARSSAQLYAVVVSAAVGVAVALVGRDVLPDKYYRDERALVSLVRFTPPEMVDTPFGQTAQLYRLLGIGESVSRAAVASAVLCVVLAWVCRPANRDEHWWSVVSMCAFLVLAGVYLTGLNKELLVLPVVLGFAVLRGRRSEGVWLALALVYAMFLRANWIGVVAVYVFLRVVVPRCRSLRALALVLVVLVVLLAAGFRVVLGEDLHYHRLAVGDSLSADINTRIVDPLPATGLPSAVVNGVWAVFTFMFPVPLLVKGSAFYLLAAGYVGGTWFFVWRRLRTLLAASERSDAWTWYVRLACFLFAFSIVQSLYAPDWGAYIRHTAPTLPLVVLFMRRQPAGRAEERPPAVVADAPARAPS